MKSDTKQKKKSVKSKSEEIMDACDCIFFKTWIHLILSLSVAFYIVLFTLRFRSRIEMIFRKDLLENHFLCSKSDS